MKHRNLYPLVAVAVYLATAPVTAMTVTTSPLAPDAADTILAFDAATYQGGYLCSHGSATAVDVGQTFLSVAPATLDKITLKVRAASDDTRGELVTLKLGTFTDGRDEEMNEVLRAETAILPQALTPGVTLYLTFDFADLVLEAGRHYGFLLGFSGGGNVNNARLEVMHLGADAYGDGQAIMLEGAVIASAM